MAVDRRFLNNFSFWVYCRQSSPKRTRQGEFYIVGDNPTSYFKDIPANSIVFCTGSTFIPVYQPAWGDVVFCQENNSFMRFEGNEGWKIIAACDDSSKGIPSCEFHPLTADEVSAKSFSLSANINSGDEANVICLVENVAQIVGKDFTASGNSISWNNKGLDDIPLVEGDTFIILYTKSKS